MEDRINLNINDRNCHFYTQIVIYMRERNKGRGKESPHIMKIYF